MKGLIRHENRRRALVIIYEGGAATNHCTDARAHGLPAAGDINVMFSELITQIVNDPVCPNRKIFPTYYNEHPSLGYFIAILVIATNSVLCGTCASSPRPAICHRI